MRNNMARTSLFRHYLFALSLWVFACITALKFGVATQLDPELVMQLRLPRVILATAVGMGLAVAGTTLQALFTNPLCEPYTLGISTGSALGSVLGISLGLQVNFAGLAGSSFFGALFFTGLLYLISLRPGTNNLTLLLAGVMLGFLGSSLVALWMAVTDANGIQGAILWLMGDLSRARIYGATFTLTVMLFLAYVVWTHSRELDALLMGEEGALVLGIPVAQTRRRLILMTSIIIGLCVSGGGMIGFVGLIIPHFVRRLIGSLHINTLPLCAIWGSTSLVLADTAARTLVRPYELPVGVVTALVGAPLFLWMMLKRQGDA